VSKPFGSDSAKHSCRNQFFLQDLVWPWQRHVVLVSVRLNSIMILLTCSLPLSWTFYLLREELGEALPSTRAAAVSTSTPTRRRGRHNPRRSAAHPSPVSLPPIHRLRSHLLLWQWRKRTLRVRGLLGSLRRGHQNHCQGGVPVLASARAEMNSVLSPTFHWWSRISNERAPRTVVNGTQILRVIFRRVHCIKRRLRAHRLCLARL